MFWIKAVSVSQKHIQTVCVSVCDVEMIQRKHFRSGRNKASARIDFGSVCDSLHYSNDILIWTSVKVLIQKSIKETVIHTRTHAHTQTHTRCCGVDDEGVV